MQATMKTCSRAFLVVLALCLALLPRPAWADDTAWGTIDLKAVGDASNEVAVYIGTSEKNAVTLNVSLEVKTSTPEYIDVSFDWSDAIDTDGTLLWDTPYQEQDGWLLSLYAGDMRNMPFQNQPADGAGLYIGTVILTPSSNAPEDATLTAVVEVADTDDTGTDTGTPALRFVDYGNTSEVAISSDNLTASDPVTVTFEVTGKTPDSSSSSSAASSSSQVTNAPRTPGILGETPTTNGNTLSDTGDQMMPLVITLVCVAALAAAVIVGIVVMRRRKDQSSGVNKR